MAEKFSRWDTAEHLRDEDEIAAYLEAATEEGDPALMVVALGNVARARNVMQLAKEAGMTRAGLYRAFSGSGNPSFATVSALAKAMGYRVAIVRDGASSGKPRRKGKAA